MHDEEDIRAYIESGGSLNRRRLLKYFGVATVASSPLLSAACGSDSGGGGGAATTSGGTTAASGSEVGAQLTELLGDPGKLKTVGSFKSTGTWPLTGQGAVYGEYQTKGWKLGLKHLKEWAGLDMTTDEVDHKSGNPQAGAAAGRQAGLSGSPVFPSSYLFVFGSIAPACKQYKMLSFDGGGGTGPAFNGIPYCYGFRAGWPQDPQVGLTKLLREKLPEKTRYAVISWDAGAPYVDPLKAYMSELYQKNGIELTEFVPAPIGGTNYEAQIQKVKESDPDVIVLLTGGTDCGYQAKAIQRAGITATIACSEYTPDAVKIAGTAYKDWYFGYDFLNVKNPTNDWTKLFIDAFREEYGKDPINYSAAYYTKVFAYAELMKRILDKGGDIKNGEEYIAALEEKPTFPHVYGGSGSTLGEITIDTETHSPSAIPMIAFQADGNDNVTELATYNVDARDYKLV
jgi:branched-chain amino acid transport system substrate-binding protein